MADGVNGFIASCLWLYLAHDAPPERASCRLRSGLTSFVNQ